MCFHDQLATIQALARGYIVRNGNKLTKKRVDALEARLRVVTNRLSDLEIITVAFEEGELPDPPDAYSFISIGAKDFWDNPWSNMGAIVTGFLVFFFQIFGILLLLTGIVVPSMNGGSDFDNPDKNRLIDTTLLDLLFVDIKNWGNLRATYIPSNNTELAITTQIFAALAFVIVYNASSGDVINSFKIENLHSWRKGVPNLLRWLQGSVACITTIVLIMSLSDAKDIFMNILAVNYVSEFDEIFFQMAKQEWFGTSLKRYAEEIDPDPMLLVTRGPTVPLQKIEVKKREYKVNRVSYVLALIWILVIFGLFLGFALKEQFDEDAWTTELFHVHFDEPTLRSFSGCYNKSTGTRDRTHRRFDYTSFDDSNPAAFKYCSTSKHWVFLRDNYSDPCSFDEKQGLAYSSSTAFDIAYDFDNDWVDPYNKRLEMYFFKNDENSNDPKDLVCDAAKYWRDGICNQELNTHQSKYDGGDCCTETCEGAECGLQGDREVFGVQNEFPSFPDCKEFDMTDISITLESYNVTEDSEFAADVVKIFSNSYGSNITLECNNSTEFSVDINQAMKSKTYVATVNKNARCVITTRMFKPILNIDTDIKSEIVVEKVTINEFPTSIGSLENFATDERMLRINLCK